MTAYIIGFLIYFVIGYITTLVIAWGTGNEDTAGFWFSITAFWPLMWITGLIIGVVWLFDGPPTWVARKGRKWADRRAS